MSGSYSAAIQERGRGLEKFCAVMVVVAIQGLIVWGLRQPLVFPLGEDQALKVIFVFPQPPSAPPIPASPLALTKPNPILRPRPNRDPGRQAPTPTPALSVNVLPPPASSATGDTTAVIIEGNDSWELRANTTNENLTFRRDLLGAAPHPLGPTKPGRFRMRKQITPQDIVRGVSQLLGFWPPGYTDDPCGGIRRSVEMLRVSTEASAHWQLVDALEAEEKYCY